MDKLLSIGKILNFHGIKGEVKVGYSSGKEKQLKQLKNVYVQKGDKLIDLTIVQLRFHKQFALVKFNEINSIEDAIELKGALLKVDKNAIEQYLEEDEYYFNDLIGLNVFDTKDNPIGVVENVNDLGAEQLLIVKTPENKEFLIPFVKAIVPVVDIKNKKIIIEPIPGLIDSNAIEVR